MASSGIDRLSSTWITIEEWAKQEIIDARDALEASEVDGDINRGRITSARKLLELGGTDHAAMIESVDYHG